MTEHGNVLQYAAELIEQAEFSSELAKWAEPIVLRCPCLSTFYCLHVTVLLNPIIIIIMALQPFVGPWPLFQFLVPIHSL
jgi:hypothetical protein